jgi:hypothetical protein
MTGATPTPPTPGTTIEAARPPDRIYRLGVDVSGPSLQYVPTVQKRAHARASIPAHWIIDLVDEQLEVSSGPTVPAEARDDRLNSGHGPSDQVPVLLDRREIARLGCGELLP